MVVLLLVMEEALGNDMGERRQSARESCCYVNVAAEQLSVKHVSQTWFQGYMVNQECSASLAPEKQGVARELDQRTEYISVLSEPSEPSLFMGLTLLYSRE